MEIRHLRCFLAVAEELHFARAAERLHIEQSPLSRAIKELEEDLGIKLFVRTTRSTRLTRAGKLFQEHVPRVFTALQQARESVKAAANGFHGQLRVALSDGITPSRFSTFLALCRQEEPEIEIRLSEVPLTQQIKGLHDRSEEHTSELQSQSNLVCRLLLEKKKKKKIDSLRGENT